MAAAGQSRLVTGNARCFRCGSAENLVAPYANFTCLTCLAVVCPEIECETQQYIRLGECCPVCAGQLIILFSSFHAFAYIDLKKNMFIQPNNLKRSIHFFPIS